MSRLVATSLLLLTLLGFGSCQDEFKHNESCINIDMKMQVSITYLMTNGTNNTITVPASNYSAVSVYCTGNSEGSIEVTFLEDFILTMDFYANGTDTWSLHSLMIQYLNAQNSTHFVSPLLDEDVLNGSGNAIRNVNWGTSYRCNSNVNYDLTGESSNGSATITFQQIEVQVFNFSSPGTFTSGQQCSSGSKSDDKIVPIAVGCALAGLVVIVLIAYLIGRFRSRNTDSYQVLS